MLVNEQTLKIINKHGDVLLTNDKKIIALLNNKLHLIIDLKNDVAYLKTLLLDNNGIQFAKQNFYKPEYVMPCLNNKDLSEILNP